MKSKLRNAIIVSILCLMALCSVIALVAVFAANNQTINSAISVSFKAPGILGKVSANYYIGSQDISGTPMTTDGTSNGAKELVFNGAEGFGSLNPQGDIELTFENNFVVFEYIFQNGLGDPVANDYIAELSLNTSTSNNLKMTTKQSKEKVTDYNMIATEIETTTGNDKAWIIIDHNEEDNLIKTKYFYVKVEIDNLSIDASFSGNFNWELSIAQPSIDALTFTLINNDHYAVAYNASSSTSTDIIIPKTYTGDDGVKRPVTEIADYGFRNYIIDGHIYVPDSITSIGGFAFEGCSAIKGEVIIPDTVETINGNAFRNCVIQTLILGKNISFVGVNIFRDVQKTLVIESSVPEITTYSSNVYTYETLIIGADFVSSFNNEMFPSPALQNIKVNSANEKYTSVDKLGKECNVLIEKSSKIVIQGCANSIIPADDSVTTIGEMSFYGIELIQSIVLPDNIIDVGLKAFYDCYNLTEVTIDGQEVCENLINWENGGYSTKTSLIDHSTTIKAKYEITGIEGYSRKFTKSENKDSGGYWVYTYTK